jgi:putative molybdopterin biosynthesis protein
MMRIVPRLSWTLEADPPQPLDGRLLPLLEAIAASESLAAAVAAIGISYRAAWGLLRDYERRLGVPLALLERGRGARLTTAGRQMLRMHDSATNRLARILSELAAEVGKASTRPKPAPAFRLRVAASHDLVLAALAESLPGAAGLELEITFVGSLPAVQELVAERADVAGFHVPVVHRTAGPAPYLRLLRPSRHSLVRFADREQGLILPPGNPAKVRNLRDIARKGLRFVNRQRGSGTRILVDRMIVECGIEPGALAGYNREEFTHAAIAATVASGGAEAGFGVRAAAAEYDLAFVPLVRERYFLALRTRDLGTPAVVRLLGALRAPAFAALAKRFPGYRATGAGAVTKPESLVAARRA